VKRAQVYVVCCGEKHLTFCIIPVLFSCFIAPIPPSEEDDIISPSTDEFSSKTQIKVSLGKSFIDDDRNGELTLKGVIVAEDGKAHKCLCENCFSNSFTVEGLENGVEELSIDDLNEKYGTWTEAMKEENVKPYRATPDNWAPSPGKKRGKHSVSLSITSPCTPLTNFYFTRGWRKLRSDYR
jgi:hypothetical protein